MCSRRAVVSCSRPGRTGEVHNGQPSGAVMTWMFPPWLACLADHHRSTPGVGPGVRHRSVSITVRSARSAADQLAWPVRTEMPTVCP